MVTYYFVTEIVWQGVPFLEYPKEWDANKIHVGAYDNEVHTCYSFTENDELWDKLKNDPKVAEITQDEYVSNLQRLRLPPPEVAVRLTGKGKNHKVAIENLLKTKDVTYRIEER